MENGWKRKAVVPRMQANQQRREPWSSIASARSTASKRRVAPAIALACMTVLGVAGGCRNGGGLRSLFGSNGTLDQQRANAVAPSVPDGRPREFARPLPEPVRDRLWRDAAASQVGGMN
jgi:hypothetical protein